MATREENLKAINEELEKLSDEELEKVAGGGIIRLTINNRLVTENRPNVFNPEDFKKDMPLEKFR